eukprot:gene11224-13086_t
MKEIQLPDVVQYNIIQHCLTAKYSSTWFKLSLQLVCRKWSEVVCRTYQVPSTLQITSILQLDIEESPLLWMNDIVDKIEPILSARVKQASVDMSCSLLEKIIKEKGEAFTLANVLHPELATLCVYQYTTSDDGEGQVPGRPLLEKIMPTLSLPRLRTLRLGDMGNASQMMMEHFIKHPAPLTFLFMWLNKFEGAFVAADTITAFLNCHADTLETLSIRYDASVEVPLEALLFGRVYPSLTELIIFSEAFQSIDASVVAAITKSMPKLTSITLKLHPFLSLTPELINFLKHTPSVTSIDINPESFIDYLLAIKDIGHIKQLKIDDTVIEDAAYFQLPESLTSLHLCELSVVPAIPVAIQRLTLPLSEMTVNALESMIDSHRNIRMLKFTYGYIESHALPALHQVIQNLTGLTKLSISAMFDTEDASILESIVNSIFQSVSHNQTIQVFDFQIDSLFGATTNSYDSYDFTHLEDNRYIRQQ